MKRALALVLGAAVLAGWASVGIAAERSAKPVVVTAAAGEPTSARTYRKRTAYARTYRGRRVGFYSYSYRDVINTYGMSRSLYGSINSYRDPYVDRQTPSGPFDHGFFFDSGILPRGGNAPYLN